MNRWAKLGIATIFICEALWATGYVSYKLGRHHEYKRQEEQNPSFQEVYERGYINGQSNALFQINTTMSNTLHNLEREIDKELERKRLIEIEKERESKYLLL